MKPEEETDAIGTVAQPVVAPREFAIREQPLVASATESQVASTGRSVATELPRSYSAEPALFAIARDPQTVFVYWDIDWPAVFGDHPPLDQKVHVRFESSHEERVNVEPFAGSCYLSSAKPGSTDRLEIGFYEPAQRWHSVAFSNSVTMPSAGIADEGEFNVVTIPFHLQFQRMIDLFRASKFDGVTLTGMMTAIQARAEHSIPAPPFTEAEQEILRTMEWQLSASEVEQRRDLRNPEFASRSAQQCLEQILGFGAKDLSVANSSSRS